MCRSWRDEIELHRVDTCDKEISISACESVATTMPDEDDEHTSDTESAREFTPDDDRSDDEASAEGSSSVKHVTKPVTSIQEERNFHNTYMCFVGGENYI